MHRLHFADKFISLSGRLGGRDWSAGPGPLLWLNESTKYPLSEGNKEA